MSRPAEPAAAPTSGSGRLLAVLLLAAVSVSCMATTVALDVRAPNSGPGIDYATEGGWSYALTGLVFGVLAVIVVRRDRGQAFAVLLAVVGVFWSLDGVAQAYVRFGLRPDEALPGMTAVLWFLGRFTAFLPISIAALLLIFPTGRMLGGWWGRVSWATLAVMSGAATLLILSPGITTDVALPPGVDLDAGTLPWLASLPESVVPASVAVAAVAFLVAMATVVVRYRISVGIERDRMRWLLWAVIAMSLALAVALLFDLTRLASVSLFLVMVLPGVAMTVALVNPRVVSIADLLSATIVYGGLTVAIVLVDLAVLAGLTAILDDALDQRQIVLIVLLLSALVYLPLRAQVSSWTRRLLLGDRDTPYDAVSGLATALESAEEGAGQLAAVARSVATAFGVSFVRVEVERSGGERVAATYGDPPQDTRTLPISYRDQEVGRLVLPARGVRSRLTARDEQLLGDLVRQAATAVRTSRLADELDSSRTQLVLAREEERRRIRRDLHDGLGPSLSGLVYQLESARLVVERDPDVAADRLASISTQLQDVVGEVRRVVHDLRPPALDDRGLVGALRQHVERLDTVAPRVAITAPELGDLPAAVEVAAYRIVGEALTNALRHAQARVVTIGLEAEDGDLVVTVADDGRGIPPDAPAGVGLISLRERAAELGGTVTIACPETGGTSVRARLPLRGAA